MWILEKLFRENSHVLILSPTLPPKQGTKQKKMGSICFLLKSVIDFKNDYSHFPKFPDHRNSYSNIYF